MVIALNDETLFRNIENNGKQGSGAGDIIIHQHSDSPTNSEYPLSYFDSIPDHPEYHSEESLKSKKRTAVNEILKVFLFDKFQVNGTPIECDNRFIIFI